MTKRMTDEISLRREWRKEWPIRILTLGNDEKNAERNSRNQKNDEKNDEQPLLLKRVTKRMTNDDFASSTSQIYYNFNSSSGDT